MGNINNNLNESFVIDSSVEVTGAGKFWGDFFTGVALIAVNGLVVAILTYCEKNLYISFRKKLTEKVIKRYFNNFAFYNVNNSGLDNVDQRITMDIDRFCKLSAQVIRVVIIAPFTIAWYSYKCYQVTWWGPLACFIFFLLGSIINNIVTPYVVRESKKVELCEGDYRWQNARVRRDAELLAMSKGDQFEYARTRKRANTLFSQQVRLERYSLILNSSVSTFQYLGSMVPYFCLAPMVLAGDYKDKKDDELAQLIGQINFVVIMLIYQFTNLFGQIRLIADILACGKRVSEVYYSDCLMKDTSDGENLVQDEVISNSRVDTLPKSDKLLCVRNATINRFGTSINMVNNLSFDITAEQKSVLIVGGNGFGKTTFFRACSGLWSLRSGRIQTVVGAMFVQETPALTDGTLTEQLSYPHSSNMFNTSMVEKALEMVGLGHFVDDLDKSQRWETILSLGERQMISFARIFLQKPSLVFLDEASSALTNEKERQMYELLLELKIPFVSISHRPENLKHFHDRVLNFHRDGLFYWQQWEE